MKKLIFIGHELHQKTRSSDFLIELLKTEYDISIRHIDPYSDAPYQSLEGLEDERFDILICWQIAPPINFIENHINYDQGVFFPMFDCSPEVKKFEYWYPFRKFHIICFSRTLHQSLELAGFSTHGIQYFPKPPDNLTSGHADQAFFWCRTEKITCRTLEQLFEHTRLKRLHIHKALDPNKKFTPPKNSLADEITYSSWYPEKSDMLANMEECALYIAPRKKEGIGMSFLEAMARGRCVIAPDLPTMNEYITHGKTGILYSLDKPKALTEFSVDEIQEATYQYMLKGHKEWKGKKSIILTWLTQPVSIHRGKLLIRLLCRGLTRPFKITKMLMLCYGKKAQTP